jgi:hypothetical protein
VSLIERVLVATRVLSTEGRWPGQCHIRGAETAAKPRRPQPRPLRWPGQRALGAERRRPARSRTVLTSVLQSLTSRFGL